MLGAPRLRREGRPKASPRRACGGMHAPGELHVEGRLRIAQRLEAECQANEPEPPPPCSRPSAAKRLAWVKAGAGPASGPVPNSPLLAQRACDLVLSGTQQIKQQIT
eukprot:CAMPEP_0195083126 /NCGR_PEP_ID=MMETSP0448-20130528/24140_1 /TAXON_ID=66468 /ORGANISM="Heterocapsa triquestra, Strain CCMP 448" /LENGTH=106 /DNA_ID=CAMNT_0040116301 /DNA_START=109 /DNA_END=426 /DNA_ORIENTATION=+